LIPGSVHLEDFERLSIHTDDNHQFVFFFGGSFSEKDGIDIMIRAFELVASINPQLKLVLTGEAADRHLGTLLKLIETSSAKGRVQYMGFLSRDRYLAQLARADVLLMLRVNSPFANAGFPFKLTEYLASGRPVIASKVGDVEKYLTHKKNAILVEPGNLDQISSAMLYCLTHKSEIKDIGNNGRLAAEKWFGANQHSMQLLDFFERL